MDDSFKTEECGRKPYTSKINASKSTNLKIMSKASQTEISMNKENIKANHKVIFIKLEVLNFLNKINSL